MSNSVQTVVSNGSLTLLDLSINYFDRAHIKVSFNAVEQALGTTWTWVGTTDKKIQFAPAVAAGVVVQVKRQTPLNAPRHVYSSPGNAPFNKSTVDENFLQALYASQEAAEGASLTTFAQDVSAAGHKLTDLGDAMLDGDAVNLKVLREYLPYGPAATSLAARLTAEEAVTARLTQQGTLDGNLVITGFNATGLQDGARIHFAGRDVVGDGGGGVLRYDASSVLAANGVTVYAPTGGGRLLREGFVNGVFCLPVRPEWAPGATDSAKVAAAVAAGYEVVFSPKTYTFADEVAIDKSIKLTFANANEYGGGGTVIHITHNDADKSGFKVGYNSHTIRFETEGEVKFTAPPGSASFAGINCKAATVFIDGVRGTADVNGLYIENGFIGYVKRLQGPCKTYLGKVAGDSSLRWETLNLGGNTGGLSSFQIVTSAGFTQIEHIYLEAQATASLAIDGTARSAVSITNIYGENAQQHDILINNAENVTIENYRTNSNTESIKVRSSSNVRINNVLCVDRLSPNEVVDVDAASSGVYVGGVLYDPESNDGTAVRTYAIIRGLISGAPAQQMIVNAELQPSAGGQVSTVGGSVTTAIPVDRRMRIGTTSVAVSDSAPIKIPFTDWAAKTAVVIQCIYKTDATSQTAVAIQAYKSGNTQLLNINDFHVPSSDWQVVTIITRLPDVESIDQYSTLRFVCDSGVTADVHMLTCSRYDGGMLPFGVEDDSVLLVSDSVSLDTLGSRSVLAPRLGGNGWRFKQYELVYTGNTGGSGALGTVSLGDANASGVLAAASANFATALNRGVGAVSANLSATGPYPFADHANTTANGWVVEVTGAAGHGGTARAYIRAVKSKYAL